MTKTKKFAAIDIGSFNCRLLVIEKAFDKYTVLETFSRETNLIKNISFNNEFDFKKINSTLKCLEIISKKISNYRISDYRCIATEACRQVINPDLFIDLVKKRTGLIVEIISTYEEARLSLKSCSAYMNKFKNSGLIFDIGGGSTEITYFNPKDKNFLTKSISFGVVNYSEKIEIYGLEYVNKKLKKHFFEFKKSLLNLNHDILSIGSCSTVTSLCAIFLKLKFFQSNKIEGKEISRVDMLNTCEYVNNLNLKKKKTHACIGGRHKLLTNGIIILTEIFNNFPISNIIATNKGLRDGMINDYLNVYENKT